MNKLRGICLGAGYFSRFHYEAWARLPDPFPQWEAQPAQALA